MFTGLLISASFAQCVLITANQNTEYQGVSLDLLFCRVCCPEVSVPTHWGRRTPLSMGLCAPGSHDWASRLSSWTWARSSSTPTEPSSHRTCLTSSTWRRRVTVASPSPSANCCFRSWRRRRRRDGHRWCEGLRLHGTAMRGHASPSD